MSQVTCIRTFPTRLEAELAQRLLEAHGIPAIVAMDDAGGIRPEMAFIKGARLFVDADQAGRALELLPAEPKNATERRALNARFTGCMLPGLVGAVLLVVGMMVIEVVVWLGTALFVGAGVLILTALVRGLRDTTQPPGPTLLR